MRFTFDQKILFKHCDPAGIVFYPRYFEIINDCIEAFFAHIGTPFERLHQTAAVPTAEITTRFTAPSHHGDELTLSLEATRLGRTSLGLHIEAHAGAERRLDCASTLVHVGLDGRPAPWPAPLRTALTPYLRSPE